MITRIVALAVVLIGASGVVASPAYADSLNGLYTATGTTAGKTFTKTWLIIPCGSGCIRVQWDPPGPRVVGMHRQDGVWTGTDRSGCTTTIDEDSMTGTLGCGQDAPVALTVTKAD